MKIRKGVEAGRIKEFEIQNDTLWHRFQEAMGTKQCLSTQPYFLQASNFEDEILLREEDVIPTYFIFVKPNCNAFLRHKNRTLLMM